jgi:hypothetical protein
MRAVAASGPSFTRSRAQRAGSLPRQDHPSEDLYARVAKVDDDNMAVGGHADPGGGVHLTGSLPLCAELLQEHARGGEHLQKRVINQLFNPKAWPIYIKTNNNNKTEWAWTIDWFKHCCASEIFAPSEKFYIPNPGIYIKKEVQN